MELKIRRRLFFLSIISFVILAPLVVFYSAGYRLATDWSIKKTGGIYISSPVSGSEIFLNGEIKKQTNILQSGIFLSGLRPGLYDVLSAKDGYITWKKKLAVKSEFVTEAHAFLVPIFPEGQVLLRGHFTDLHANTAGNVLIMFETKNSGGHPVFYLPNSKEFLNASSAETAKIIGAIRSIDAVYSDNAASYVVSGAKIIRMEFDDKRAAVSGAYVKEVPPELLLNAEFPDTSSELIKYDSRKRTRIYAVGNVIFAEWLHPDLLLPYFLQTEKERVVAARERIRSLDFYPRRYDLMIYSEGVGVYVAEIDGRGERNIQPLYKGKSPVAVVSPDKKMLYVLDNEILMEIKIP